MKSPCSAAPLPVHSIGSIKALYKKPGPTTFTSHCPRTRSSARDMFVVKESASAPCYGHLIRHSTTEGTVILLFHRGNAFCRGPSSQTSVCRVIYRYALKAPRSSDVIRHRFSKEESDKTYKGLSRMLDIVLLEVLRSHCAVKYESKMKHYYEAVQETNLVAIPLTQIRNVLYDAMRRPRKWANYRPSSSLSCR